MGALVAGVDSSTQFCKVVVRDVATGALVRQGRAAHPPGTEVDPAAWEAALAAALADAGGLQDVDAVPVAGQQHGLVLLDDDGAVVRPALLWHDTRSASAASALVGELGGPQAWADAVGVVPVASITVSKLRWVAEHEPGAMARAAAACLPHDWLTWRLVGGDLAALRTDRSDASGTGYWDPTAGYRPDLVDLACGRPLALPAVLGPTGVAGGVAGAVVAAGAGDNAAAALGLGAGPGDVVVSVGTSGVAAAPSDRQAHDPSGQVAGFADATGGFLPLVCTLNGAPVLDAVAGLLGVDLGRLSDLALSAPAGAGGLVLVPYLAGERTPDRPDASGALHGATTTNLTPANVARAAVEGLACGLADAVDALVGQGVEPARVLLVGGAARSRALHSVLAATLGCPVVVPQVSEAVADGAARQAAWALVGGPEPPAWPRPAAPAVEALPAPGVRDRYRDARELTLERAGWGLA